MKRSIPTVVKVALRVRWIARVGSIVSIGILLLACMEAKYVSFSWQDWVSFLFFPVGLTIGLIIAWWRDEVGGAIAVVSGLAFYVTYLPLGGTISNGNEIAGLVLMGIVALPGILFISFWLLKRSRPEIRDWMSRPAGNIEAADGIRRQRQRILVFVLKHFYSISFLLIVIVGGYFLETFDDWHSDDGTPLPMHFSALTYDKIGNQVRNGYSLSNQMTREPNDNTTYLLPADAARNYIYEGDTDAFYSVTVVSKDEQIITYDYETGVLGHATSRYRAFDKRIEPIYTGTSSVLTWMIVFGGWLMVILFYLLVKFVTYLYRRISSD